MLKSTDYFISYIGISLNLIKFVIYFVYYIIFLVHSTSVLRCFEDNFAEKTNYAWKFNSVDFCMRSEMCVVVIGGARGSNRIRPRLTVRTGWLQIEGLPLSPNSFGVQYSIAGKEIYTHNIYTHVYRHQYRYPYIRIYRYYKI